MCARAHTDEKAAISASAMVLVAFDGAEAIDIAGPASVFSKAEELRPGTYRLHIASPAGGTIVTNSGLSVQSTHKLNELPREIDTLLVVGGDEAPLRAAIREQGVSEWLVRVGPHTRRIASVCSGAFALAAAGLLDGRQATTALERARFVRKGSSASACGARLYLCARRSGVDLGRCDDQHRAGFGARRR